nr:hypothetical protein Iba_chr13eCG8820 [Ipomoea batatas]
MRRKQSDHNQGKTETSTSIPVKKFIITAGYSTYQCLPYVNNWKVAKKPEDGETAERTEDLDLKGHRNDTISKLSLTLRRLWSCVYGPAYGGRGRRSVTSTAGATSQCGARDGCREAERRRRQARRAASRHSPEQVLLGVVGPLCREVSAVATADCGSDVRTGIWMPEAIQRCAARPRLASAERIDRDRDYWQSSGRVQGHLRALFRQLHIFLRGLHS